MAVQVLRIHHFRNLKTTELALSPGFNFFSGPNGAGKTSLLEALFVLGRGRSFRAPSLDAAIQNGESSLGVGVDCMEGGGRRVSLSLEKAKGEPIQLFIDRVRCSRLSDAARKLPLQLISPDVSDLVFGGPTERRHYLDWGLFHVKQSYHMVLRNYAKALRQRNSWLRTVDTPAALSIDPWADTLAGLAESLHGYREDYCNALFPIVTALAEDLGLGAVIELNYHRGWRLNEGQSLAECLRENARSDVKSLVTRLGAHRAEIQIRADGRVGQQFLSRGQAKLLAIAMKLAQTRLLNDVQSVRSLVLFDELVAELDPQRYMKVLSLLKAFNCQALMSAVDLPAGLDSEVLGEACMFHVEHGVVKGS